MTSSSPSQRLPAFQHPVRPGWVASVALVNVGLNTAIFATLNQLLPMQSLDVAGEHGKEAALSLAGTVGVVVAMVVNLLAGALSDRTRSRSGRRTPWILVGALVACGFLLLLSTAESVATLCLFWAGAQAGLNAMMAAVTACVPDRVRPERRGLVGGIVVTGITVGVMLGSGVGMVAGERVRLGYLMVVVGLVVSLIPYLLTRDDPQLAAGAVPRITKSEFMRGFAVNLRTHRDFGWAWLGRLLMMTAIQLLIVYLLFFLRDQLHHSDPPAGVFLLTAVYAVGTVVTAALAGQLSDRTGRRPLVAVASALVAVAAVLLAVAPLFGGVSMAMAVVAAVVLGIGNGSFLGVDFALITQVLPDAAENGRGMGLINVAASLPQIFSLGLAWLAVTHLGGYTVLFTGAAVIAILAAASVYRVRSVK
ncbi:MFS transporter [Galactobacter sp.]|uniref:MFS transporter n=1 Tax=Galactobacter sp. TaxID=2676125 RepID=UPI0025C4ABC0|nr:MFS transporter [Galactobacter sp.]